jgi:hypothetical protein
MSGQFILIIAVLFGLLAIGTCLLASHLVCLTG